MYRPEGMRENPFKETVDSVNGKYPNGIAKGYHVLLEAGRNEGFEVGADAMLEGLKKGDQTELIDNRGGIDGKTLWRTVPSGKNGYLVFIPEELG